MSQREVAIVGSNNTKAKVTGQEELLVKVNSINNSVVANIIGAVRSAYSRRESGTSNTIPVNVYSISFASTGTANAQISTNGGGDYIILKPGETVSYNAGDINNYFAVGTFAFDTTLANSELLVIYTY